MTSIRDITAQIRNDPKYNPRNSYAWFRRKIQDLGITTINTKNYTDRATFTQILPGFIYTFMYDPKTKETMPYYDRFPLVIPFNKDTTSFIGLNLHYINPYTRLILLDKLSKFNTKTNNNEMRMKLSWQFLKNASRFPQVAPCVKRYLFSHCKSKFLKIPDDDWYIVSQMPTDVFKGAKNTKVWADSRLQIGY
jgi:hypothetical protein